MDLVFIQQYFVFLVGFGINKQSSCPSILRLRPALPDCPLFHIWTSGKSVYYSSPTTLVPVFSLLVFEKNIRE